MDYEIETTALNLQENFNIFRIRCIMLILENLKVTYIPVINFNVFFA